MNCTKRWSHLAEGNQPCVPRLVRAQSHSWGRKRAVQGLSLFSGWQVCREAGSCESSAPNTHGRWDDLQLQQKKGREDGGKKEARVHSVITRAAF